MIFKKFHHWTVLYRARKNEWMDGWINKQTNKCINEWLTRSIADERWACRRSVGTIGTHSAARRYRCASSACSWGPIKKEESCLNQEHKRYAYNVTYLFTNNVLFLCNCIFVPKQSIKNIYASLSPLQLPCTPYQVRLAFDVAVGRRPLWPVASSWEYLIRQ